MGKHYFVIQEAYSWVQCSRCKGAGKTTRTFQRQKFTETCSRCGGKGREKLTQRTQVRLEDALREINANQNNK